MEPTNNNNSQLFLSEFKELRNELSAMKKQIVQLEKSHEKQQERLDILERENHAMKTELNILNGNKEGGLVLKRKRIDQGKGQDHEEKIESKSASASTSAGKKKTKTNNNNNNNNLCDNGDSFDSLSDDLLHKIVEFDGNCYTKFGLINKRCKNIYDMKEYKLKKQTCVFGYGTVDMMLGRYLQRGAEGKLDHVVRNYIAQAVIMYNRLDAVDWIFQLGDSVLLGLVCGGAAYCGRINILTNVFLKSNVTMLVQMLNDTNLCYAASWNGKLGTLKWLRNHTCSWDARTFFIARDRGYDEVVQYLRLEGCPEPPEDRDESSGSEQIGSDDEDNDN